MKEHTTEIIRQTPTEMPNKVVIVMVGLPARGKSYIAQQIVSFYQDAYQDSSSCRLFNAGKERRSKTFREVTEIEESEDSSQLYRTVTRQRHHVDESHRDFRLHEKAVVDRPEFDESDDDESDDNDDTVRMRVNEEHLSGTSVLPTMLFDTGNADAVRARDQIALATTQKLCIWLESHDSHRVALFDATNTTAARRAMIFETVRAHTSAETPIIFTESVCNDPKTIHNNILHKVTMSPDYLQNPDKEWCYRDFRSRLLNYERVYEPCDVGIEFKNDTFVDQIKVVDKGAQIVSLPGTSLAHDCGLLEFLDHVYQTPNKQFTGALPRMLDSISAVRSSCSSTSSSLFSIPGLLLANCTFELENAQNITDEVLDQVERQTMLQNGDSTEHKQRKQTSG
ncbi:LAFA_0D07470g1_1 [Lachancea sp. 'fantastica']|nr:LAFA_0D07470g1_1 [Lachancea sp. 'fantastica']